MGSLAEGFERVLTEYPTARTENLTSHPVAALLAHDLRDSIADVVGSDSYKVTGSPGRGNWAETPWVSVFDRLVTETAQRGFYVVYLFRGDGAGLYLSLNQGTTEVLELIGSGYLRELESRASMFVGLLSDKSASGLVSGSLSLGGTGRLTRGYEAGNVYAIEYAKDSIPTETQLADDLHRLLDLYASLVSSRDRLVDDSDPASVEIAMAAGLEAQRERWHKRSERNPRLARDAKKYHGSTCQVCDFNFEAVYGGIGAGFIEAHHLTPFSELKGRPTKLDPKTDFIVVCPNCHRMLHRRTPPLAPLELQQLMN